MIKNLFKNLKKTLDSERRDEPPSVDTNSPIGQLTTDKIKAIVAEINQAKPLFDQAGFELIQLEIEIGLVPKILPRFKQLKTISTETEAALLKQLEQQKLLAFIMQSLFKSSRMSVLLAETELDLHGIEISISAPPSVRTIFTKQALPVSPNNANASEVTIQ
ncbi:hypothetical protein ACUR5C_10335 [Aliikangiella sp. IMCC44653]